MRNKIINSKKGMALSQIFILVISIVAFSYFVGSEFRIVSAFVGDEGGCNKEAKTFEYDGDTYSILSPTKVYGIGCSGGECKNHYFILGNDGIWRWEDNPSIKVSISDEPTFYANSEACIDKVYGDNEGETEELRKCSQLCEGKGYTGGAQCTDTEAICYSSGGDYTAKSSDCSNTCCCSSISEDQQDISNTNNPAEVFGALGGLAGGIRPPGEEEQLPDEALQSLKDAYDDYNSCVEAGAAEAHCRQAFPDGERAGAPFGWDKKLGGWGYFLGHLVQGIIWAGAVVGTLQAMKAFLPERAAPLLNALSFALGSGILVGKTTAGIVQGASKGTRKGLAIGLGVGLGTATALIVFFATFKKKSQEVITFTCMPWEAPTGGSNCEECNKQGALPCSEYQCRSLGQACELVNPGTDKERCVWINRGDVEFPIIEPFDDALLNNYEYTPDNAISPPDRGVRIEYTESTSGCVKAFTPLSFGVTLDEPAKCKIDVLRKEKYEDMDFFFSGGLLLYNHTYALSLPGSSALENEGIEIENDGEYSVYVRCQDANGNSNTANFVFNFCVEQGPDTTPPLIVTTDPLNDHPFAYNQTSINSVVYINEPVEGCKWSHVDQTYENMEETMDCSGADSLVDMDSQGLYSCTTILSGLKDRQENKFYLRCKDVAGNTNIESYEYNLIGTQPLVIDTIKPETGDLIKDSTDTVKVTLEVETSAGYNEGEAECYYGTTGETEDYVLFFNTGSYQHSQDLWLASGNYDYFIKCIDLGGNSDVETINFDVESDSSAPLVVRAYHEETYLKLVTSEAARCVYDTTYENYPCDYLFDDGTLMTTIEDINHYANWNPQTTFYVKCEDEYGTQPNPDECSIIVRPSDII